eukprot:5781732-Pyramimonas_sp.AAC.1
MDIQAPRRAVQHQWNRKGNLQDDPNIGTPVRRGTMAYAGSGVNSRSTQIWISFQPSRKSSIHPPTLLVTLSHAQSPHSQIPATHSSNIHPLK